MLHKVRVSASLVAAAALLSNVSQAWHLQVHNQIAFMAERMLDPNAVNATAIILDKKYSGSIGRAAGWADTVRKDKNGKTYSYDWHFVSMHESINMTSPPSTCHSGWSDVCSDSNCVVAQLVNQTSILKPCIEKVLVGSYVDDIDCQQALMWVVHFIGDIGQPLHTSGTSYGGNTVSVVFNGTNTNLHDVWDRGILYVGASYPSGFSDQYLDKYFTGLLARIAQDALEMPRDRWEICSFDTAGKDDSCAKRWAEDSHALVCNAVYARVVDNTTDLMTDDYAKKAFPIVELQLAKAAWRMAGWLNFLVRNVQEEMRDDSSSPQNLLDMGAHMQQVLG